MTSVAPSRVADDDQHTLWKRAAMLSPLLAGLAYPFLLRGFNYGIGAIGEGSYVATLFTAVLLIALLLTPLLGLLWVVRISERASPTRLELTARRLAYLTIVTPPLYVFVGVTRGLIGRPFSDNTIWFAGWFLAAGLAIYFRQRQTVPARPWLAKARVAHGVSATLIVCFAAFHLFNHLLGWLGDDLHTAVMHAGRTIYRSPLIEPALIALLFFQIAGGARLAWIPCRIHLAAPQLCSPFSEMDS